jgi:hypothetical protein
LPLAKSPDTGAPDNQLLIDKVLLDDLLGADGEAILSSVERLDENGITTFAVMKSAPWRVFLTSPLIK